MTTFRKCLLFLLQLLWALNLVKTQNLPSIACPEYFEYQRKPGSEQYFGKITLPPLFAQNLELNVSFTRHGVLQSNDKGGSLFPYPSRQVVKDSILVGNAVTFVVEFPYDDTPAKLTDITVNGKNICRGTKHQPPRTWYMVYYKLIADSVNAPAPPATTNPFLHKHMGNVANTGNVNAICGREAIVFQPLMYGGTDLMRGQFPWMTAIYKKETMVSLTFTCGGSLISQSTVITAAHCFNRLSVQQVALFLGRHNLDSFGERGVVGRDALKITTHPDYKNSPDADLAIVQIQALDSFTDYIRPICLWSESNDINAIAGQRGSVAGWGSNGEGLMVTSVPKVVEVGIVSEGDCMRSSPAFAQILSPRTFCAGRDDDTGPCQGDSGGGLVMFRNQRWVLRGIVSTGQMVGRRCNLNEYVIYTDVAKHLSWVRDNST